MFPPRIPMVAPKKYSRAFVILEPTTEEDVLKEYASMVLDECGGNKSLAAKVLGIDRRSLYRRLGYKWKADEKRGSFGKAKK